MPLKEPMPLEEPLPLEARSMLPKLHPPEHGVALAAGSASGQEEELELHRPGTPMGSEPAGD